jgi:N-acetylglucosamine-6-phosphate deacetylase
MAGVEGQARDGAARVARGVPAGSTLTLDAAVHNWAALTAATPEEARRAASETPHAAVGLVRSR